MMTSIILACTFVCIASAQAQRGNAVAHFNRPKATAQTATDLWPDLNSNMTLTVWVKVDTASGVDYMGVAGRGWLDNATGFGFTVDIKGARAEFETRVGNTYAAIDKPFPLRDSAWHHLAGVREEDVTKLYIDGVFVGQDTKYHGPNASALPFRLGTNSGEKYPFFGEIAEVQLWDYARTETEIRADMFRCLSGDEPGLVGYWPLDEGEGLIAADKTPAGNHITLSNVSWQEDIRFGASLAAPDAGWLGWWPLALAEPDTGNKRFSRSNSVDVTAFPVPAGADAYGIGAEPSAWLPVSTPPQTLELDTSENALTVVWFTNTLAATPPRRSVATITYAPFEPAAEFRFVDRSTWVEMGRIGPWQDVTNLTLQVWVKADIPPENDPITQYGAIAGCGFLRGSGFGLYAGGPTGSTNVHFWTGSAGDVAQVGKAFPFDGTWHNLTGVRDEDVTRLYFDGELVGEVTKPLGSLHDPKDDLFLLALSWDSGTYAWPFRGSIAEVRLWDFARTESEIQADMRCRLVGDEPGLIAYWPLDDATGTVVRNLAPVPRNGTFHGQHSWDCTFDMTFYPPPPPPPRGTVILVK